MYKLRMPPLQLFWFWGMLLILIFFFFPIVANQALSLARPYVGNEKIAPLFTRQVQYWSNDIARWGEIYGVDPNLIATIMQIESCGHPTVISRAGAQGLFQVMPFHFSNGEDMLEPETNAFRGTNFIKECSNYTNGDVGLTLACYNGGASGTSRGFDTWPDETQRYYIWGLGIYIDAMNFSSESDTLDQWLNAGGSGLCNMAAVALGVP